MTADRGHTISVLFINRVYPPDSGATGRMLHDLAHAFARDGWNVTVLCAGKEQGSDSDESISIHRIQTRFSARHVLGGLWVLLRLFVAGLFLKRTDLIVTMTDPPLLILAGRFLAFFKRAHHIHWCQDLYPDLLPVLGYRIPGLVQRIAGRLSRSALRACDRVAVIGRCMARRMTKDGVDPRKIAILPNWPDFELVYAQPETTLPDDQPLSDRPRKRAQTSMIRPWDRLLKDEERKFRVLYAGTIGRAHPLETILDAAELIAHRYPEIEFVFVGEGKGHDHLAEERTRRGLHNIRQLSWQPVNRLRTLMESGDVHLVSMRHDATGLIVPSKIYSAFAVGRPCVFLGPSSSDAARVISDERAGTIVPQGNPALLAETIIRYRLSSNDWFMAQEGALRILQAHLPENTLRDWVLMARSVIDPTCRSPDKTTSPSVENRKRAA